MGAEAVKQVLAIGTSMVKDIIAPSDAMFRGNVEHYFKCGASALTIIQSALALAGLRPATMLDYGAGAGRVTRWLEIGFPNSDIHACELDGDAVDFLNSNFRVAAWRVESDPSSLSFPTAYDLIWVGSVITHLSEPITCRLTSRLLEACNPNGILIMSFHGRAARVGDLSRYGPPQKVGGRALAAPL
jgi:SAM-dependent methyltransferase